MASASFSFLLRRRWVLFLLATDVGEASLIIPRLRRGAAFLDTVDPFASFENPSPSLYS